MALWRKLVEERFGVLHEPREDKRMTLGEAVRLVVRGGMKLNLVSLQSRPGAATYELCRQFKGRDPQWEFISSSIGGTYLSLVHLGLVRRAVVSFAGEAYPTPGPSPVIARALASGALELENMTMLTVTQRLLAGAMGVPFITTRSLAGSSIGAELPHVFKEIDNPFEEGGCAGLLRAYRPDVSFVHAWASDAAGNALCHPPGAENIYGALAAREGVILTADHIVSTDFIRRHAHLGRIPGSVVRAVCHAPLGAHPSGNFALGIPEFEAYGNDYEFMIEHRKATATPDGYDQWLKEWVFDPSDHAAYLEKLGEERRRKLRTVAEPESWRPELDALSASLEDPKPANPIETMIIEGARVFAARMKERGHRTVLSGVGHASLMTWLASHILRGEGIDVNLMAETGFFGHEPRPADPFVFNYRNLPTTTMLSDIFEVLGLHTGGAANRCLGAIGAAQIDRHGNVNSTRVGGRFIVGSGGANDIASAAAETLVIAQQRRELFVDQVEYVTSPGGRIRTVVSSMGVFDKLDGNELMLTGYYGVEGTEGATVIREIKALCGWDLKVVPDPVRIDPPSAAETVLLRMFDPERHFLGKLDRK